MTSSLRLVFWETTKACNLNCRHCRAVPQASLGPTEMQTPEALALMDQIAEVARPVLVLSGGEPLFRPDLFTLGAYGVKLGFRMALATNGTLIDRAVADRVVATGFSRVAVSLDGAKAGTHDLFRNLPGSHARALDGISALRKAGMSVQINSTIAKHNVAELPDLLRLALDLGADALHLFMLVPVGCGVEIAPTEMLPAGEYERVLHWFDEQSKTCPIDLKATCAPHYFRIMRQRAKEERIRITPETHGFEAMTKGCLAGSAVCFVSHKGEVYPCGYLPVSAGNVRKQHFRDIWESAEVFRVLRDEDNLQGKCGYCEFRRVCMGCRARAYGCTGNYLDPEPYCVYEPRSR